ncbi:hypothetical protein [Georgenia wangjunii]|uniref:hypothetical protein n=1 Tax=Georgenia wangjunii TaxID=3117730 RepID=UPI002F269807
MHLWLRTGGMWLALVACVTVVLVVVFSRDHWTQDIGIAVEWANGSTVLLSPLAGAIAAFTVWRAFPRELQALTRTIPRGARAALHAAVAVWLTAAAAWFVGVVTVVIGVWLADGTLAARDPWVVIAGPAAIFPAVMLGTLGAVAVRSIAMAPLTGVLVYVLIIWTYPLRMPALMAMPGPTGTWTALRPLPDVVAASVLLNGLVGAVLAYGVWRLSAPRLRRPVPGDGIGVLGVLGVVLVLATFAQRNSHDTHYVEHDYSCAGDEPRACLNETGELEAEAVAAQFRQAHRALADSGLELPEIYYEDGRDEDSGVLLLTAAPMDGGLTDFDLAMSVARPAQCDGYSGDAPPEDALAAQWVLGHWLDLTVRADEQPAQWRAAFGDAGRDELDGWAREAHTALAACDLDAEILRELPDLRAVERW